MINAKPFLRFRHVALILFCFTLTIPGSFAQSWRWAKAAGGPGSQQAYTIASDSAGNHYVGGEFSSSAHFGTLTVTGADSSSGFIAKIDSTGQWLWVKTLTGPGTQLIKRAITNRSGYIFLLGYADPNSMLDGTAIPNSGGSAIIATLNTLTGNLEWVTRGEGIINDITLNANDKPYVCGTFLTDSIHLGAIPLYNTSPWAVHRDAFVASLSTATGTWDWATAVGGSGYEDGYRIASDGTGNIYLAGQYYAMALADTTHIGNFELPGTTNVAGNLFLAKLNLARNWQWAITTETIDYIELASLAVRYDGVAYLSGHYAYGDLLIGRDTIATVTNSMVMTPFTACISSSGHARWGAQTASGYDCTLNATATNSISGTLLVSGTVTGDSLQLGGASVHLPNGTTTGYFTAALDSTGHWTWAMPLPTAEERTFSLTHQRQLAFAGSFAATTAFGAHPLVNTSNQSDAFAVQLTLPPFVHRFAPANGPAGTVVVLRGEGFAGATAVLFGTIPATSFTVLPDGSLQVTVPPGVSNVGVPIRVVGIGGTGQSVGVFGRGPQGVAAEQAAAFELWPNPAHGRAHLTARAGQVLATVTVRDAVGRIVRQYAGGTATADLSLVGLPAGLYVVQAGATIRRLVVE
jgi:IPT/TIG domain